MMLKKVTIKKNEIALLTRGGEIKKVLEAGTYRVWDLRDKTEVVTYDYADPEIKGDSADYLRDYLPELTKKHCINLTFGDDEIGLRYDHNVLVEVIGNSRQYLYWRNAHNQRIEKIKLENGYLLPQNAADELVKAISARKPILGIEQILFAQISVSTVGLLKVESRIVDILPVGAYSFWQASGQVQVETCLVTNRPLNEGLSESLLTYSPELVEKHCVKMEVNENEVGLRYENGLLTEILAPGTQSLYWRGAVEQRLEKVSLENSVEAPKNIVNQLVQPKLRKQALIGANGILLSVVPAYHVGILKIDGKIERVLEPGVTAYWRFNRSVCVEIVDTRLQSMEVSGQEILTRDKVNLRINLIANWRYSDILQAHGALTKPEEHIYRELQFGLREAVGTRTLDELLENKQIVDEVVSGYVADRLTGYGIEVASLGVKDIVLPGDMKTILSQVVEAEKAAQANVIRRREETAATRSLLNTARVMENNPVALRLKEMETLERVAERIDKISVFGGLDQVLNGLVKIQAN